MSEPTKPSLWERIKTGVKGFFSHAIGYIPRGIVFTAGLFAAAALVGQVSAAAPVLEFFGMNIATMGGAQIATKFISHLVFGSLLSGALGGTVDACKCGSQQGGMAPACPMGNTEKSKGQEIARTVSEGIAHASDLVIPGAGLPLHIANKMNQQSR